jgi:membrane protein
MNERARPGTFTRLRARFGSLDHMVRAFLHFRNCNGNLLAGGLTHYTLIALFPLLMVGFAVGGFALSRQPELLSVFDDRVRSWVSPELAQYLVKLINSSIAARVSLGVIGLVFAAWIGQTWMYRIREALGRIWGHPVDSGGFVRIIMSDLAAVMGTFLVILTTMGLTALYHAKPMAAALKFVGIPEFSVLYWALRAISVLISFLVSWLVFSWVIVRLPHEPVGVVTSMRAGLIAAVGFELFKLLGSLYLRMVLRSAAGATFGPVLGLLVFAYLTWVLVLFSAAWAVTASADPGVQLDAWVGPRQAAAPDATGAGNSSAAWGKYSS